MRTLVACPDCEAGTIMVGDRGGNDPDTHAETCPTCEGTGEVPGPRRFKVTLIVQSTKTVEVGAPHEDAAADIAERDNPGWDWYDTEEIP